MYAGPYAAFLKGGLHGGVAQTGMLWASAHSPPRGVWGHAPPENFGNLDSLRAILRHSDSDLQKLLATRLALCTLAMQSIAHPVCVIWKATFRFIKKHVSLIHFIISSAMLGGQKGGFVRTPSNPPCVRAWYVFRCTSCH